MLRRVTYISTTPKEMADEDLLKLFSAASKNAAQDELTGLTIYHRNSLFHVREGDSQRVSTSIVRASSEGWQYNVSVVQDDNFETRLFDRWHLGFVPDNPEALPDDPGLVNLTEIREHAGMKAAFNDPAFCAVFEAFVGEVTG